MCLRSLKMCLLLALLVGFVHLLIIVVCSSRSSGQAMDRNQDEEKNQVQQFQQQLGHPEGIPENDKTKENLENEKGVHEEDEDVRIVSDGEQNVTRVILPSYMRSGSSFTASLFNQHCDVFYIHEPLWNYDFAFKQGQVMTYLDGTPSVTYDKDNSTQMDTLKKDTIRAYLSCHLQHIGSLDFAVMQKPWAKARTKRIQDFLACWHPVNDLQSLKKCLPLIQRDCDTAKVTVVKTLRFTMTQALTLTKSDPRVKVVHLVRDPRAVMYSRNVTGVGWGYHETFQYLCGRILQDVQLLVVREEGKGFRQGSACLLEPSCTDCGKLSADLTSKKSGTVHTGYDINRRLVTALAVAVQKFNQGSTALLSLMLELELLQTPITEEYAEHEDIKRVKKATIKSCKKAQEKRKRIGEVRRKEQQQRLEREGVTYGAGEF